MMSTFAYGMPTGNGLYGVSAGIPGGYNMGFGKRGYGSYGQACRKQIRSDDLPGARVCFCDKNHRNEDPCNDGNLPYGDRFPDKDWCYDGEDSGAPEMAWDKDYYQDIFDEDCEEQFFDGQLPTHVRAVRCNAGQRSMNLPGPNVCICDKDHKKDNTDEIADVAEECLGSPVNGLWEYEDFVSWSYTMDADDIATYVAEVQNGSNDCGGSAGSGVSDAAAGTRTKKEIEEEAEKLDVNCFDRQFGYGRYGTYGRYNNFNAGYNNFNAGYNNFNAGYNFNAGFGYPTMTNNWGTTWGTTGTPPATTTQGAATTSTTVPTTTQPAFNNMGGMRYMGGMGYRGAYPTWGR